MKKSAAEDFMLSQIHRKQEAEAKGSGSAV